MDVGSWLRGLGLGQYETAFRENAVDSAVLPELTADDLRDLGVGAIGDRRKLLVAIAALKSNRNKPTASQIEPQAQSSSSERPLRDSAERRPITVMFCDLVGSTSLSSKLDAEDWRDLVNGYLEEASKAVTQYGGHVLKRLGDGLMALFGYPKAQENDAERAARAGLAILRALEDLNAQNAARGLPALAARVGLESGPVVVDSTGEVFGDAPNIAARVQSTAEPGTLLVTATVQRQVAGMFVADDKGLHDLKGVPGRLTLYRLVRASGGRRRAGARSLTPLVGREEELATLTRRWDRAKAGDGQFVQIVGEPGLGKSRLIAEFQLRLGETPHTWVEWASSQLLQNTPLYPVAEWGRQRFTGEKRFADLEAALAEVKIDPAEFAPLLAPLLDIATPADRAPQLAPEELRRRQLAAAASWIMAGARAQPLVLAVEDLHWADPTTLDLMKTLVERGGQAPLLIVSTARPEFRPPWTTRSHHSVVGLAPLDRAQIGQMVGTIAERHALSRDAIEGLSDRTAGVPLFIEELTRLVLEGGTQTIPPTLEQSLAARLDRLGEAREVAQIGAVLGREFSRPLLKAVAELPDPTLDSALEKLLEADLVFIDGIASAATYRFKHALIQDAAYESLLKSRRQALHARAAQALLATPEPPPELVAHHFTQSGQNEEAIDWWGKAGDVALRRSAFQEAIAHLGKAIEIADRQADTTSKKGQLHSVFGNALLHAKGYDAMETSIAFAKARQRAGGDPAERLMADYGLWAGSYLRGELPAMRELAKSLLECVAETTDSPEAGVAHRVAGVTNWFAGEYVEAREHLEQALALFHPGHDDSLAFRFGHDAGAATMVLLALVLWPQGEVERAARLADEAATRTAALGFVGTHGFVRMHSCMFALMRADCAAAVENASRLSNLAQEHDLPMWRAFTDFCEGVTLLHSDRADVGLDSLRRGAELLRERGVVFFDGLIRLTLADAEARAGNLDLALGSIKSALETVASKGYCAFEAELYRLQGELLLRHSPHDKAGAEEALKLSVSVAQQQGTRVFQLRSALPLARLLHSAGRSLEAHSILATALEGLSPSRDLQVIAEAQTLLAELAQTTKVKSVEAQRQRRLHLQTAYGHAVMMVKGFASDETNAAFARVGAASEGTSDFSLRFAAAHGQWTFLFARGELTSARALASNYLKQAELAERFVEAGVAHRSLGLISLFTPDLIVARSHFEQALAVCNPERDREARERFIDDTKAIALSALSVTEWELGEADRARERIDEAIQHARELGHAASLAHPLMWLCFHHLRRGDAAATLASAVELTSLGHQNSWAHWAIQGELLSAWARGRIFDAAGGAEDFRRALEAADNQGRGKSFVWTALLAQLEAEAFGPERALARIDEAETYASRSEERMALPFLYILRGELQLRLHPSDSASAEASLQTALSVAKHQGARSWGLRAALLLAHLHLANERPLEAYDVLAPALQGFVPTPELPAIEEAQALLEVLATNPGVKDDTGARQARTVLHGNYAKAMLFAKGFAAPETRAALDRARESADDSAVAQRFEAQFGEWVVQIFGGDLALAETIARTFLQDAEASALAVETYVGLRMVGVTEMLGGHYCEARERLVRAIDAWQPNCEAQERLRFAYEHVATAKSYLAIIQWHLGKLDESDALCEAAIAQAEASRHPATMAIVLSNCALVEMLWGRIGSARRRWETLLAHSQEHRMPIYSSVAQLNLTWARARESLSRTTVDEHRAAVERYRANHGIAVLLPLRIGVLAELLAENGDLDEADKCVTGALSSAVETGRVAELSFLHRIRGDILLRRKPSDVAAAEYAFRAALEIAREQGARTFGLQAALPLARLLSMGNRAREACDILSLALEGFAPTPEFPEITEAQNLIAELAVAAPNFVRDAE